MMSVGMVAAVMTEIASVCAETGKSSRQ